MSTAIVLKELKCVLSDREKQERGETMARKMAQVSACEGELDGHKRAHKEATGLLEREISGAATELRQGFRWADVEVRLEPIEFAGEAGVREIRMDTGEELEVRAMTAGERQMGLFGEG